AMRFGRYPMVYTKSVGGEAAQKQIEKAAFIGMQTHLHVRSSRSRRCHSLLVYIDVHGFRGTKIGPEGIGDRNRVEERWGWAVRRRPPHPFVVEQSELVGERRSMREDLITLSRLERYLS